MGSGSLIHTIDTLLWFSRITHIFVHKSHASVLLSTAPVHQDPDVSTGGKAVIRLKISHLLSTPTNYTIIIISKSISTNQLLNQFNCLSITIIIGICALLPPTFDLHLPTLHHTTSLPHLPHTVTSFYHSWRMTVFLVTTYSSTNTKTFSNGKVSCDVNDCNLIVCYT